jgi:hypothetical protein
MVSLWLGRTSITEHRLSANYRRTDSHTTGCNSVGIVRSPIQARVGFGDDSIDDRFHFVGSARTRQAVRVPRRLIRGQEHRSRNGYADLGRQRVVEKFFVRQQLSILFEIHPFIELPSA